MADQEGQFQEKDQFAKFTIAPRGGFMTQKTRVAKDYLSDGETYTEDTADSEDDAQKFSESL
jgi:hypothetical protein